FALGRSGPVQLCFVSTNSPGTTFIIKLVCGTSRPNKTCLFQVPSGFAIEPKFISFCHTSGPSGRCGSTKAYGSSDEKSVRKCAKCSGPFPRTRWCEMQALAKIKRYPACVAHLKGCAIYDTDADAKAAHFPGLIIFKNFLHLEQLHDPFCLHRNWIWTDVFANPSTMRATQCILTPPLASASIPALSAVDCVKDRTRARVRCLHEIVTHSVAVLRAFDGFKAEGKITCARYEPWLRLDAGRCRTTDGSTVTPGPLPPATYLHAYNGRISA
ncbi:unnamed protein product, partial [Mycena citricolor]